MMLINGCVPGTVPIASGSKHTATLAGGTRDAIVAPAVGGMQPKGKLAVLPFYPELALS